MAHHHFVVDPELDAELLEFHHHGGAVGLEDTEVRGVVHHGCCGAERFELGEHLAERDGGLLVGDGTLLLGEVGDVQRHQHTDTEHGDG